MEKEKGNAPKERMLDEGNLNRKKKEKNSMNWQTRTKKGEKKENFDEEKEGRRGRKIMRQKIDLKEKIK